MREAWFTLRHWMRDWFDIVAAPFRAVRSIERGTLRHEMFFGGHEALGLVRGFVHHTLSTIVTFLGFLVRLPYILYRGLIDGLLRVWAFLRTAPRGTVALVVSVALLVVVGLGGMGAYLLWERRIETKRTFYYTMLDQCMNACDAERTEDTLLKLQVWAARDESIPRRLQALRNREGPASDPKMLRLIMRGHYRDGHLDLAAREAAKLVESLPEDWEARCILADDASRRNDKATVQTQLATLPLAADTAVEFIPPWVAWYAAQLFQRLGEAKRFDDMVDFLVRNVLPIVRSRDAVYFETDAKLLLIDCYRIALMQLDRRQRLVQYWVPVQTASRSIVDTPNVLLRQLLWLGQTQQVHLEFVDEFYRRKLVTEDEAKGMKADLEGRIRVIWEKVLTLEEKIPQAYIGLAEASFRAGKYDEAIATINRGLTACGGVPELVADKALLLRRIDPQAGLAFLDRAVEIEKLTVGMCQVYTQAALAASRPDKALDACRHALKLQPGLLWAARTEAEICLKLDRPTEAVAALKSVREFLSTDADGCKQYIKALHGCGSIALAEQFLEEVDVEKKPIEVELAGANAFLEIGRQDLAVKWAKRVIDREPLNIKALLIAAEGLRVQAELPERGWDQEKARESLQCYHAVLRQQDDNLAVVNNIVWLELKAIGQPKLAFDSSELLRKRQNDVALPADYMETLAAVYIATGDFSSGKKLLMQAIATAGPRPSFYIHLSLAHIGLKQPQVAEQYLLKAFDMPMSSRDRADLMDTVQLLQKR
ncbi:MAG: hypothetical protein U0746_07770 [Gemmataceae bacterium]